MVVGHADWYAGNVAVADRHLVASYDWELVADTEGVVAGFTAAACAASSTSGGGLSPSRRQRPSSSGWSGSYGRPPAASARRRATADRASRTTRLARAAVMSAWS